jgi:hypothetical protein
LSFLSLISLKMLAIAKAMTALFALLEPKITSPNSDTLFYFHS